MPGRSVRARVDDIRDAINGIEATLDGVTFDAFAASWQLKRAVERGLEIISEATRSLPEEVKLRSPEIPWPAIAAIGNILRHEYQRIEPLLIWNIAGQHLMPLRAAVERLGEYLDQAT